MYIFNSLCTLRIINHNNTKYKQIKMNRKQCVFAIKRHFDKFEPMFGKLNVVGRSLNNVSFQNPLQTPDTFTVVELDKERMQELADESNLDIEIECGHFVGYLRKNNRLYFVCAGAESPDRYKLPPCDHHMSVPLQTNSMNCGVVVVLYAQLRHRGMSHTHFERFFYPPQEPWTLDPRGKRHRNMQICYISKRSLLGIQYARVPSDATSKGFNRIHLTQLYPWCRKFPRTCTLSE